MNVSQDQSNDWKNHHANESGKALEHDLVTGVMEEFASNMGFELDGLPKYGLMKVAMYAAQVARAQALGFDPGLLRMSETEANAALMERARMAVALGKPVLKVDDSGMQRLD